MDLYGQKSTIGSKIVKLDAFPLMKFSLIQGTGAELKPCVKVGDKVKCGTLIAQCKKGFLGADLHSSVSGEVVRIIKEEIDKNNNAEVIYIKNDEKCESEPNLPPLADITLKSLCERLNSCGVLESNEDGFPLAVKLEKFISAELGFCFINACCSDAFYTADISVAKERSNKILRAIDVLKIATNCENFIIAVRRGTKKHLTALLEQIEDKPHIYLYEMPNIYLCGDEYKIANSVLKEDLFANDVLTDYGYICINVQTLCALTDAVDYGLPMTNRVITCAGSSLKEPCNVDVKIGSLYEDIIDAVGGEIFPLHTFENLEEQAKSSYFAYLDLRDEFNQDTTDEEVKAEMVQARKQSNQDIMEFLKAEKTYKNMLRKTIICGGGLRGVAKLGVEFSVTKSSNAILLLNAKDDKMIKKLSKRFK